MNAPVNMQDLQRAQQQGNASMALVKPQQQMPVETAATAAAAKVKALVEARYEMALHRPRDMDTVRQKMLKESNRPSFAEVARYRRPQGKKQDAGGKWVENFIEGPSIRFIEMAIRCMTNVVVEVTTVYDDREKRIVNVCVTDLEANVPYATDVTIQKTIERKKAKDGDVVIRTRTNNYGDLVYILEATDDEIVNHQNAMVSKVVRTLGQRLIPGDIVDECMDAVVVTQNTKDKVDPDAAKRRIIDAFAGVGVTVEDLKGYLGHGVETLDPKELQTLRGLYAAIKEGELTWREVMDGRDVPPPKDKPKDKPVTTKPETAKTEPEKQKPDPVPEKTPEKEAPPMTDEFAPPSDLYTLYKEAVRDTKTTAELIEVKTKIQAMKDEDERDLLLNMVGTKMVTLMKTDKKPSRVIE